MSDKQITLHDDTVIMTIEQAKEHHKRINGWLETYGTILDDEDEQVHRNMRNDLKLLKDYIWPSERVYINRDD